MNKIFMLGIMLTITMTMYLGCTAGNNYGRGGPLTYSFNGLEGMVLDKDTGEPIEETCVVFVWRTITGTIGGAVYSKPIKILESITDRDGKFKIDKWNIAIIETIDEPDVMFFKSGYKTITKNRKGMWKLERHNGTLDERMKAVYQAESAIGSVEFDSLDLMRKIPKTFEILKIENKRLAESYRKSKNK